MSIMDERGLDPIEQEVARVNEIVQEGRVRCAGCGVLVTMDNKANVSWRLSDDGEIIDIEAFCWDCNQMAGHHLKE